jgi:hypothetical protein
MATLMTQEQFDREIEEIQRLRDERAPSMSPGSLAELDRMIAGRKAAWAKHQVALHDSRLANQELARAAEPGIIAENDKLGALKVKHLIAILQDCDPEDNIFVEDNRGTLIRLMGAWIQVPHRNDLKDAYTLPLRGTKIGFAARAKGIVLKAVVPPFNPLLYWLDQERILQVADPANPRGEGLNLETCPIHRRQYSTTRWPECPHCLSARGNTPEEVRAHIKKKAGK